MIIPYSILKKNYSHDEDYAKYNDFEDARRFYDLERRVLDELPGMRISNNIFNYDRDTNFIQKKEEWIMNQYLLQLILSICRI